MRYEAYIFDLDGTLVDSLDSITYSVNLALEEFGYHLITKQQCEAFVGDGARPLIERSLSAVCGKAIKDTDETDKVVACYIEVFDQYCTKDNHVYEGIKTLLEDLQKEGVKLAVLSNKPHAQTVKVVEKAFGEHQFDCVLGQREQVVKKPDPAGIFTIAHELQVPVDGCVLIGDTEVDIQTGKNAGMDVISVAWGFRSEKQLVQAGADRIVDRPEEILQ